MSNVFAIIQTGGRQVKVNPGSVVTVDRVEAEVGKEVTFDQVLFLEKDGGEMLAGAPFVANAKVVGMVDGESRGPKIRRVQEEAPQGLPQDARPSQHLHARPRHRHRRSEPLQANRLALDSAVRSDDHGYKKRAGQFPQRPRQQLAAARRQAPRRQRRHRRIDPRAAARAASSARA